MTISFYVVLVLHPLPGLPGNPRPHASTSWVSPCPAPTMLHHTNPQTPVYTCEHAAVCVLVSLAMSSCSQGSFPAKM